MSAPTPRHRYPWLGGPLSRAQVWSSLVALGVGAGLAAVYVLYVRGGDVAPDSAFGYGFAMSGTLLLALVGIGYWARKRRARRSRAPLHTWMALHTAGACLGVALILMHATGNFHPRTGTYALYALLAVVVSGIIGRALDRICPRMAAAAALEALEGIGAEWSDGSAGTAKDLVAPKSTARVPVSAVERLGVNGQPWDVAFFDLDPEVEAIPGHFTEVRAAPSRQRAATPPARDLSHVNATMRREEFWLGLVRVWRRLHLMLSLVFLALLLWHIEFALTLLWNAR